MNSIDNLRDYVLTAPSICSTTRAILVGYVDSIDAEHQKVLDEWKVEYGQMWLKGYSECHAELLEGNETLASDLERCGWIRLPVDADGEPIHVGDVMEERSGHTFEVASIMVFGGSGNQLVFSDARNFSSFREPHDLRHHHAPTVEDVLREFAQEMNENLGMYTGEAIDADEWRKADERTIAEYAAKLTLRGDE